MVEEKSCDNCRCNSCEKAEDWEQCRNCIDCQAKGDDSLWKDDCKAFHRLKYKKRVMEEIPW